MYAPSGVDVWQPMHLTGAGHPLIDGRASDLSVAPMYGRSTSRTLSSPTAKPSSTVSVPVGWPLK